MNFSVLNKVQQQAEEIKDIIDQIKALEEGLNYLKDSDKEKTRLTIERLYERLESDYPHWKE
tara:strand:- start:603 stop:788 length:186 start_codon:yes stop_codon:yes gene_type:complete